MAKLIFLAFVFAVLGIAPALAQRIDAPPTTINITPTGASGSATLPNIAQRVISPADFGCVPDAGNSTGTDNLACMQAANTYATANGLTINLCGDSRGTRWYLSSDFTYTAKFVCQTKDANRPEGSGQVGLPSTGNFTTYPNSLIVASGHGITCGTQAVTAGDMDGINILRAGLNVNGGTPANIQDLLANRNAFAGTGLTIAGDGCRYSHGNILGFTTGISSNGPREYDIHDYKIDATNGRNFIFQRGGGVITSENGQFNPIVTGLTPHSVVNLQIASVTDLSGNLLVTLSSTCPSPGDCPSNGMGAWIAQTFGTESAAGQEWTVTQGSDSSKWILNGSHSSFLTGQTFTGAFPNNSIVVSLSGLTLNCPTSTNILCQIQPGQTIVGTCINTTVAYVWYSYGRVLLNAPTTCDESGGETVTITDNATQYSLGTVGVTVGGTNYTTADIGQILTTVGGTCSVQPTIVINQVSGGAVTRAFRSTAGLCTVFPTTPGNAATGTTVGSGATFTLSSSGVMALSPDLREGIGTLVQNTIAITDTAFTTVGARECIKFANAAGAFFVAPLCSSNQFVQDNFQTGVEFTGTAQGNTIVGGAIHYASANVVSDQLANSQLGANRVISTDIGGNNNLSTPNQILVRSESSTPGSPANSRLELEGISSQALGAILVSDDILSLGLKTGMMPLASVFCQSFATPALITTAGTTLAAGGCNAPSNPGNASAVVIPTSSPYLPTNANCGASVASISAGGQLTVKLPLTPVTNCRFWFIDDPSNGFSIDPNGQNIKAIVSSSGQIVTPVTIGPDASSPIVSLVFNGSQWAWDGGAPSTLVNNNLAPGQHRIHGQVYFSYNSGTSNFQLCPYNGPGGLTINGVTQSLAGNCVSFPAAQDLSSQLNYFYMATQPPTISAIANDGAGKAELTLNITTGFVSGNAITCFNVTGTPLANVINDTNTTLVDSTHITLTDVSFVATGTGTCRYFRIIPSATGHSTASNGVETLTGTVADTLIGMAYVGASHAVTDSLIARDVSSWFNRQPKKMLVALGANTATTTSATLVTPSTTKVEGEFVAFGPPSTSAAPTPGIQWHITAGAAGSSLAATGAVGACFGTAAITAGNACGSTPETEVVTQTQAVATDTESYTPGGMTNTLTEGRNFMDLLMSTSAGTLTLTPSTAFIDAYLMQ